MLCASSGVSTVAAQGYPQSYPSRAVTLYVGFSAGSSNDTTARTMAQQLTESLGQPFVVMNRDGNSGVIAATAVARAKADGYTLMWGSTSAIALAPAMNRNMPYDNLKDFAPVSVYFYIPYVLVAHASVPAADLKALIALARSQPGKMSFGSTGVGTLLHLSTELILTMSGTKMVHVPYRGTPSMMLDVMSGQTDLATTSTSQAAPHIKSRRVRAIGVTSRQRSTQLPEVPTLSEGGLPGYEIVGWYSMLAPAGTPRDVVTTLNRHFVQALTHPAVKANIALEGALPGGNTPEQFAAFIRSEFEKYSRLIKDTGIKPEL
jgi:tripartite-type tricarboxylate transporter receptor subunit TctC